MTLLTVPVYSIRILHSNPLPKVILTTMDLKSAVFHLYPVLQAVIYIFMYAILFCVHIKKSIFPHHITAVTTYE